MNKRKMESIKWIKDNNYNCADKQCKNSDCYFYLKDSFMSCLIKKKSLERMMKNREVNLNGLKQYFITDLKDFDKKMKIKEILKDDIEDKY